MAYLSFKKGKRRRSPHGSSTILRIIKNAENPRFLSVLSVGASAPNPDTKDFSGKVPWNLKSFAKTKWGGAENKNSGVWVFIICGIVVLISIKESQFEFLYFCHVSAGI